MWLMVVSVMDFETNQSYAKLVDSSMGLMGFYGNMDSDRVPPNLTLTPTYLTPPFAYTSGELI